jgi:hypothetical protein
VKGRWGCVWTHLVSSFTCHTDSFQGTDHRLRSYFAGSTRTRIPNRLVEIVDEWELHLIVTL